MDQSGLQDRLSRRLHRQLRRLNETALVIDASLASPDARAQGIPAHDAHQELFGLELVIHNLARLTERLAARELPASVRAEIRSWMCDPHTGRGERIATAEGARIERSLAGIAKDDLACVRRLRSDVADAARLLARWPQHHARTDAQIAPPFESSVTLLFGDLPGSALVSAQAATPGPDRRGALLARLRLDPPAQIAIRVAVAVGAASALGAVLSERRFYWAVIAVFIAFLGANTAGEQVIKAINRVAGTIVGILIGSLPANAIGHSTWSIEVIVMAVGLGIYFMKVSYGLMVIGITVMVSQLYQQLGEYSNHLLVLRLEETSIRAAVAALCALFIFPVGTRWTAGIAARAHLDALADLLSRIAAGLREQQAPAPLSAASRALDHAHQQLLVTARPLGASPLHRERIEHNLALFTQTAQYARNLAADLGDDRTLGPDMSARVVNALEHEHTAVQSLAQAIQHGDGTIPPQRLDDSLLELIDDPLADTDASAGQDLHRTVHQLDRLDEAIAELGATSPPHERKRS